MNIVICFSPDWIKYVQLGLFSLFSTNRDTIRVYLFSDNLPSNELQKCQQICNYFGDRCAFEYINLENIFKQHITSDINLLNRFGKFAMYRLFIPHLLNEDKILYIDADALVVGDISEFYNLDMRSSLLAGCVDTGIMDNHKNNIGMNNDDLYFNSGVLLFNNAAIKKSLLFNEWMRLANEVELLGVDQDILNMTTQFKKIEVSPIYNVSLSTKYDFNNEDIRIIHWAGEKPWQNADVIFYSLWQEWEDTYNECFP